MHVKNLIGKNQSKIIPKYCTTVPYVQEKLLSAKANNNKLSQTYNAEIQQVNY